MPLIAECAAVLAWIGCPGQRAFFPVHKHRLPASERFPGDRNRVAKPIELLGDRTGNAALRVYHTILVKDTWCIQRLLQIHPEFDEIGGRCTWPNGW